MSTSTSAPRSMRSSYDEYMIAGGANIPGPSSSLAVIEDHPHFADVGALLNHCAKIVDQSSEYILSIDRSTPEHFWLALTSFYKGAISKPQKLRKSLVVNFVNTGESGSDSGALRKEFFEDSLRAINFRLFEGEDDRRVPKKDVSLELLFEVAGMVVAHSILQEGPGIPCLSPAVFDYLTHGDVKHCYPTKDDIPLNISTHELITLIEEVCSA